MTYKTVQDADFRLRETIVTYDGQPVMVTRVEASETDGVSPVLRIDAHPFRGDGRRRIPCSDPGFCFTTPRLGYVNYFEQGNRHVVFGERVPNRQNKQGLTNANTQFVAASGQAFPFEYVRRSDGFLECIVGEYPSYEVALERLVPDSSLAVSRDFAIVCDAGGGLTLVYRRAKVGTFFRGQLYVASDKQWLLETIREEPNLPDNPEVL